MARPNAGGRPRLCADQSFTHFKLFYKCIRESHEKFDLALIFDYLLIKKRVE